MRVNSENGFMVSTDTVNPFFMLFTFVFTKKLKTLKNVCTPLYPLSSKNCKIGFMKGVMSRG